MPDPLGAARTWAGATLVIATGHDLSLALLHDGAPVAAIHEPMVKGHAEALVPAIAALLAPFGGERHPSRRIIVEVGPGSFTGLRVGLAAAKALALAWGAELLGVRSTQLVAAEARSAGLSGRLLVALLAPRGQVWVEGFGDDVSLPPQALLPADAEALAGHFGAVAGTALLTQGQQAMAPRAAAVAGLALSELGEAEILYVSAPDIAGTGRASA